MLDIPSQPIPPRSGLLPCKPASLLAQPTTHFCLCSTRFYSYSEAEATSLGEIGRAWGSLYWVQGPLYVSPVSPLPSGKPLLLASISVKGEPCSRARGNRGVWGAEAPQGAKTNIKYWPNSSYKTNIKSQNLKILIFLRGFRDPHRNSDLHAGIP